MVCLHYYIDYLANLIGFASIVKTDPELIEFQLLCLSFLMCFLGSWKLTSLQFSCFLEISKWLDFFLIIFPKSTSVSYKRFLMFHNGTTAPSVNCIYCSTQHVKSHTYYLTITFTTFTTKAIKCNSAYSGAVVKYENHPQRLMSCGIWLHLTEMLFLKSNY